MNIIPSHERKRENFPVIRHSVLLFCCKTSVSYLLRFWNQTQYTPIIISYKIIYKYKYHSVSLPTEWIPTAVVARIKTLIRRRSGWTIWPHPTIRPQLAGPMQYDHLQSLSSMVVLHIRSLSCTQRLPLWDYLGLWLLGKRWGYFFLFLTPPASYTRALCHRGLWQVRSAIVRRNGLRQHECCT